MIEPAKVAASAALLLALASTTIVITIAIASGGTHSHGCLGARRKHCSVLSLLILIVIIIITVVLIINTTLSGSSWLACSSSRCEAALGSRLLHLLDLVIIMSCSSTKRLGCACVRTVS